MELRTLCEPCFDCLDAITAKDTDTTTSSVRIANIQGNSGTAGVEAGVNEGEVVEFGGGKTAVVFTM